MEQLNLLYLHFSDERKMSNKKFYVFSMKKICQELFSAKNVKRKKENS